MGKAEKILIGLALAITSFFVGMFIITYFEIISPDDYVSLMNDNPKISEVKKGAYTESPSQEFKRKRHVYISMLKAGLVDHTAIGLSSFEKFESVEDTEFQSLLNEARALEKQLEGRPPQGLEFGTVAEWLAADEDSRLAAVMTVMSRIHKAGESDALIMKRTERLTRRMLDQAKPTEDSEKRAAELMRECGAQLGFF